MLKRCRKHYTLVTILHELVNSEVLYYMTLSSLWYKYKQASIAILSWH